MAMLNVKQVNKQGQISIGKKYAGKKVQVDLYPDGTVILKPVEIISEFEIKLLKDNAFQDRLKAFDRWEANHKPSETDLFSTPYGPAEDSYESVLNAALNFSATSSRLFSQSSARGSAKMTFPPMASAMVSALFSEN